MESEIQVFIDGTKNYFNTVSNKKVAVGVPYLVPSNSTPAKDFSGIIGVSGERKGCVYFSAPRIMLHHLLLSLGEISIDVELMRDLVGEIANTVSGNARSSFGSEFHISVPVVVQGAPEAIQLPKKMQSFVIPVSWQNYSADLVVCLSD